MQLAYLPDLALMACLCVPLDILYNMWPPKARVAACLTKVLNSSLVRSKGLLHMVKKHSMLVNSASCVHAPILSMGFLAWDPLCG
jgi:hypothetical protein